MALGTAGFMLVETYLSGMAGETLTLAATEIADKLDRFLYGRKAEAQILSRVPLFQTTRTAEMTGLLGEVKSFNNAYRWLGVTDANGRIIAASDSSYIGEDRHASQWFQSVRDTGKVHVGNIPSSDDAEGVESLAITAPITGGEGEFRGTVTVRIGLSVLEDMLTQTVQSVHAQHQFLGTIRYQFVDSTGRAFIDSDLSYKGNVNLKELGVPSALKLDSGKPGYVRERDRRRRVPVMTGYATLQGHGDLPSTRWGILVHMDENEVLAPTRTIMVNVGLLGGGLFVPLVGCLFWMTTRLQKEWVKAEVESARAQAAESKYRLLLESTGEGIYGIDRNGRCTFINTAASLMLGYGPEEVLGRDMHGLHHHTHRDGSPYPVDECPIYHAFTSGQPCHITDEVLWRRNGTAFPADYSAYPVLDGGAILGAVVTFVDIGRRQQVDESLRLHGEILRHMAEGICLVRAQDAAIIYANPTFENMFGYGPGEIIGQPVSVLNAPGEKAPDAIAREIIEHLHTTRHWSGELQNVTKDGTRFWSHAGVSTFEHLEFGTVWIAVHTDITERKRVEESLRESEERFRSIVETTKDWVWSIDRDGTMTYSNPAIETILGYTPDELLGRSGLALVHEEDRRQVEEWLPKFITWKRGWTDMVLRWRHKDGSHRYLESSAVPILAADGELIGYRGVDHDITARRRAEAALSENNVLLQGLFESAPDAIVVVDQRGRITRVNARTETMFGYNRGELYEKPIEQLLPERFRQVHGHHRAGYHAQPGVRPMGAGLDLFGLRQDGREFPVDIMLSPMRTNEGQLVIAIVRDITARRLADEALRKSEERFQIVARATNDALWDWDIANNTVWWSENVLTQFGYAPDEIAPSYEGWENCVHPEDLGRVRDELGAALAGGQTIFTMEHRYRRADGTYAHVYVRAYIVRDEAGRAVRMIGARMDVTERKEMEEALRANERQLRHVLDERERLSQDLHDNIIQAIYAVGMGLEACLDLVKEYPAQVGEKLRRAIADLNHVIRDVRNYIVADVPTVITAKHFREELARLTDIQGRNVLRFRLRLDPLAVKGVTPEQAKQILFIAKEAMSNSLRHSKATSGHVSLRMNDNYLRLEVKDNGIGFQVNALTEGHGLRNIAARALKLNARLKVLSERGFGTLIILDIPKENLHDSHQS